MDEKELNKVVDKLLAEGIKRYKDAGREITKTLEDAMYFGILGTVEFQGVEAAEKWIRTANLLPSSNIMKTVWSGYATPVGISA